MPDLCKNSYTISHNLYLTISFFLVSFIDTPICTLLVLYVQMFELQVQNFPSEFNSTLTAPFHFAQSFLHILQEVQDTYWLPQYCALHSMQNVVINYFFWFHIFPVMT